MDAAHVCMQEMPGGEEGVIVSRCLQWTAAAAALLTFVTRSSLGVESPVLKSQTCSPRVPSAPQSVGNCQEYGRSATEDKVYSAATGQLVSLQQWALH